MNNGKVTKSKRSKGSTMSLAKWKLWSAENSPDMSIKKLWLLVYFKEADPGNDFDILSSKKIVYNPQDMLEQGVYVTINNGKYRSQGIVVHVSDTPLFLQKHFDTLRDQFLVEPDPAATKSISEILQETTHTDYEYANLLSKHEVLEKEYKDLQQKLNTLRDDLEKALYKTESNVDPPNELNTPSSSTQGSPISNVPTPPEVPTNLTTNGNKNNDVEEDYVVYDNTADVVLIGSGRTQIPRNVYDAVNWYSHSTATRKLMMAVFKRTTLATHSLTGKPSPAFIGTDKVPKMRLDPVIVADIVEIVSKKCCVNQSLVRGAITTKCADENKMYKKRMQEQNKENKKKTGVQPKKEKHIE